MGETTDVTVTEEMMGVSDVQSHISKARADIPAQVHQYLDCIACNPGAGEIAVGCSSLEGRYWTGGLFVWSSAKEAPDVEKCLAGVSTESGVSDLKFIQEHMLIVGEDNGSVEIFKFDRGSTEPDLTCTQLREEHDDAVLNLDVSCDRKMAVTGGADNLIKLWQLDELSCVRTLSASSGYSAMVTSVSCHHQNNNLFLSTSSEGSVMLWDARMQNSVNTIANSVGDDDLVSCVCWTGNDSNTIAEGCESGFVCIKDTRHLVGSVARVAAYQKPVFRLNSNYLGIVAACANDSPVICIKTSQENSAVIYNNDEHLDFVRGLCWSCDCRELYSCGWDKIVLTHTLSL